MEQVPEGSIYFWMYRQGLRHFDLNDVLRSLEDAGKKIRQKDIDNYWNGWHNSELYHRGSTSILGIEQPVRKSNLVPWEEYPDHPFEKLPLIENRWVPCHDGKPMIKWGNGCMPRSEAEAYRGCNGLAENLKGCRHIVIDFDGDHDPENLDLDCILFGNLMARDNSARLKPLLVGEVDGYRGPSRFKIQDMAVSLHVEFIVDKVVPSMHFPSAHIDILGNERNQIRYFKNKKWNGVQPQLMTPEIWNNIINYIKGKERM